MTCVKRNMTHESQRAVLCSCFVMLWLTGCGKGSDKATMATGSDWQSVVSHHSAKDALLRMFPSPARDTGAAGFKPTGLTRKDYLKLIAGEVDFWKQHQDEQGAIIDPYENAEKQYSTPAFALAGAELV